MLDLFQKLGERVERVWSERNNDVFTFADIAANALIDSEALNTVGATDIINWVVSSPKVPQQHHRDFGQPPINLYLGKGFLIEALFWIDSTTAIHQHAFSGAFGVLSGSSVHSMYQFKQREAISEQLLIGDVDFISSELLQCGDVRPIHPGDKFIHSLFHLDRPTVSVVIRTFAIEELKPQYQYMRPWIAFDPFHKPEPFMTRLRLLDSLRRTDLDSFWQAAQSVSSDCNAWMLYMMLSLAYHKFRGSDGWESLIKHANSRFGGVVECLIDCLRSQNREIKIIARREAVHDPILRFFLALLLNVPDKQTIHALIKNRFPERDPLSLIAEWVEALSKGNLIGIDVNPLSLDLLASAIRGDSYGQARERLNASALRQAAIEDENKLKAIWDGILFEPVLRPLFL